MPCGWEGNRRSGADFFGLRPILSYDQRSQTTSLNFASESLHGSEMPSAQADAVLPVTGHEQGPNIATTSKDLRDAM